MGVSRRGVRGVEFSAGTGAKLPTETELVGRWGGVGPLMWLPVDDGISQSFTRRFVMSVTGGTLVRAVELSSEEKTATVARVRKLERELFPEGWEPAGRSYVLRPVPVDCLNELRTRLGWLEVDPWGRWLWPS
jgi:hypothetical protein